MTRQNQSSFEGIYAGSGEQASKGLGSLDLVVGPTEIEKRIAAARRLRAETLSALVKTASSWLIAGHGKSGKPEVASAPRNNQALPV